MARTSLRFLTAALSAAMLVSSPIPALAQADQTAAQIEVEFDAGNGPILALHPDNPDIPLSGDSTNLLVNTADIRALSLNVMPNLSFAESDGTAFPATTVGDQNYPLYKPVRPYVQVSDLRGTGGGWRLTARAEQFRRGDIPSLSEAQIYLMHGTSRSSNDALRSLDIPTQIVLDCADDSQEVLIVSTLGSDDGMGTWVLRWYPLDELGVYTDAAPAHDSSIHLRIPGGSLNRIGIYSTTIHWTLTDSV